MITQPKIKPEVAGMLFQAWQDVINTYGCSFKDAVAKLDTVLTGYEIDDLFITEELCEQFLVELATSNRCLNCGKHNDQSPIEVGADNCMECEES